MWGMITLTSPRTARNLTAWFVTTPKGAALPDYAVIEESSGKSKPPFFTKRETSTNSSSKTSATSIFFIQAGDIVKGGRQDRTPGADFIVPAHSGRIPVPAFCVEERRWGAVQGTDTIFFSKSTDSASSKKLRAAIRSTKKQGDVWNAVAEEQEKLGQAVKASVAAAASPSSLQLSYESKQLQEGVSKLPQSV